MANEEHLAILKKGVEVWNAWWEENRSERPNLSSANLSNADLSGVDLIGANMSRADLHHADLSRADLSRADFTCANLTGANLSDAKLRSADLSDAKMSRAKMSSVSLRFARLTAADLHSANLSTADAHSATLNSSILRDADLSDARLSHVDLRGSYLTGADLHGADLIRSTFGWTSIGGVDLKEARNLAEVRHLAPSSLGIDTLKHSKGKIPEAFLRGCGLTDWEIQAARLYDPDLTRDERTEIAYEVVNLQAESPIILHHVFISYSHRDSTFVEKLEAGLNDRHIRYWRDVHDMKAGRLEFQIEKAIRVNPLVLLVLSERSVESDWVEWEVSKARELEKKERRDVLCPIALDDAWKTCDWPGSLRRQVMDYNILDFSDPDAFDAQFEKLVGGIVENYPPG